MPEDSNILHSSGTGHRETGAMKVTLKGGSTLDFDARTADSTTVAVTTEAKNAGKVTIGANATLTGDKVVDSCLRAGPSTADAASERIHGVPVRL
ncbi:MAG: hypothetical protein ACLT0O_09675 [Sutterella wadsworthensis]